MLRLLFLFILVGTNGNHANCHKRNDCCTSKKINKLYSTIILVRFCRRRIGGNSCLLRFTRYTFGYCFRFFLHSRLFFFSRIASRTRIIYILFIICHKFPTVICYTCFVTTYRASIPMLILVSCPITIIVMCYASLKTANITLYITFIIITMLFCIFSLITASTCIPMLLCIIAPHAAKRACMP